MYTNDKLRARVERRWSLDGLVMYFYTRGIDGKISLLTNMEFTEVDAAAVEPSSIVMSTESAQELIDELWQAGLRPTEGTGSAGALAATQNHLKDMQKINERLLALVEKNNG